MKKPIKTLTILLSILSVSLTSCGNKSSSKVPLSEVIDYISLCGVDTSHWEGISFSYAYSYDTSEDGVNERYYNEFYFFASNVDDTFKAYFNVEYEYLVEINHNYTSIEIVYELYIEDETTYFYYNDEDNDKEYRYTLNNEDITYEGLSLLSEYYVEGVPYAIEELNDYLEDSDYQITSEIINRSKETVAYVYSVGLHNFEGYYTRDEESYNLTYDKSNKLDEYSIILYSIDANEDGSAESESYALYVNNRTKEVSTPSWFEN